jgi:hypothetical protein
VLLMMITFVYLMEHVLGLELSQVFNEKDELAWYLVSETWVLFSKQPFLFHVPHLSQRMLKILFH